MNARSSRPRWTSSWWRLWILASMSWLRSPAPSQGLSPAWSAANPWKSLNQFYNKQRAEHQRRLSHEHRFTSPQLDRITTKRHRRVDSSLHTASRRIIDLLVSEGIGTLVIGKNPLWKQEMPLGKRTYQQFVQLPHARFIDQLTYKAKLVGIQVILQEESYTSKASFLDNDPLPTSQADRAEHPVFKGARIARSWYRASDGTIIHADINGSYNILRKRNSDPRPSGARSRGRGSSPQTAGALKRMTDRRI